MYEFSGKQKGRFTVLFFVRKMCFFIILKNNCVFKDLINEKFKEKIML